MESLKRILVDTYVVLIILLLLGLVKCDSSEETSPNPSIQEMIEETSPNPSIQETFKADVIFCIDCTGSMDDLLSTIKENALSFYSDMKEKCLVYGKEITSMRIKVIAFRDITDTPAYEESPFYLMPVQADTFNTFVSNLSANGGGDTPEIAYDALGLAINSSWINESDVHQVIILWTDAPSHPLTSTVPGPVSFQQITSDWNTKMNTQGKRLILFAPEDPSWLSITDSWDKVVRHDVRLGSGLSDLDYEKIIRTLSESI